MSEEKRKLWESNAIEQNEDDDDIFSSLQTKSVCECYPANQNVDLLDEEWQDPDYETDEE